MNGTLDCRCPDAAGTGDGQRERLAAESSSPVRFDLGGDGGGGAGAALGPRLPAGWPDAGDREGRAACAWWRRTGPCRSRSPAFPRSMTTARAACSTWRSIRTSPRTSWSISPSPSRAARAAARRWPAASSAPTGWTMSRSSGASSPSSTAGIISARAWCSCKDGTLIVTLGDRNRREYIADMKAQIGKLVRINRDGSIPKDNPFVGNADYSPDLYSLGHRNVQGATLHPDTGALWTVEHGARGGDEINMPQPGKNYGWPVISYGREYSGEKIGEGTAKPGLEQPAYYWDPSIAPSGMTFYTGDKFPAWKRQPVRRRAQVPAAGAAGGRRQPHRQGGAPARGHGRAHPRRGAGAGRLSLPADRRGRRAHPAAGAGELVLTAISAMSCFAPGDLLEHDR